MPAGLFLWGVGTGAEAFWASGAVRLFGENSDNQIEQQRQAKAEQRQAGKGDASPEQVKTELVRHAGAHAKNHAILSIFTKTLCHYIPFCADALFVIQTVVA